MIENQPYFDKIYLYAKDPYEAKYQYLINKREDIGLYIILKLSIDIDNFNDPISIQMICAMFTELLGITILIKKVRY